MKNTDKMQKKQFTIVSNKEIASRTFLLELSYEGTEPVKGEFVNISIEGFYLRRPISICDRRPGIISLIYKVVGQGTKMLSRMCSGEHLELIIGVGRSFDAHRCTESALLVGGGLGSAPLFPLAKELKAMGRRITMVMGFNKADEMVLLDEFKEICDNVTVATLDGSIGIKGFVTDAISLLRPDFDFFYTCGPMVMMKAVCQSLPTDGQASLEERMGCGSGFCYGCSIQTNNGVKRVCADGPVFDKEDIIW